jgi:hypothetical protein
MAQSVMNEIGEPVLYLAPTNQLVGTTKMGLGAFDIEAGVAGFVNKTKHYISEAATNFHLI